MLIIIAQVVVIKRNGNMKISETHRYEVQTPEGETAGAIYVRIHFNNKPTYIANFKIYKKFRFQGYGRKLMNQVIEKYGSDILKLRYYSYDKNKLSDRNLRKFYKSFGFEGPEDKKTLIRRGGE